MTQASPEMAPETPAAENQTETTQAQDAPAPAVPANPETTQEPSKPETTSTVTSLENWRNEMAGDDEKLSARLGRYKSIKDVGKALVEAQDKIRKGEAKSLPENPSDEQMAEWRQENNVPETWEGYSLELGNGLVIGENDKPMVNSVLEAAHAANVNADQMDKILSSYFAGRESEIEARQEADENDRVSVESSLRDAWGSDFNSNKNAISNFIGQMPESIRDSFSNGRLSDGTAILNSPEMLEFFADTARKLNPTATVVPNSANPMQAIDDELAKLNKMMKNRSKSCSPFMATLQTIRRLPRKALEIN